MDISHSRYHTSYSCGGTLTLTVNKLQNFISRELYTSDQVYDTGSEADKADFQAGQQTETLLLKQKTPHENIKIR